MDAKPQRPFRVQPMMPVENSILPSQTKDGLQQAMPIGSASTSMGNNGAMNVAAKRAAFGDIGNLNAPKTAIGSGANIDKLAIGKPAIGGVAKRTTSASLDQENYVAAWPRQFEQGKNTYFAIQPKSTAQDIERVIGGASAAPLRGFGQATKASAPPGPVIKAGHSKKATFVYHDQQEVDTSAAYTKISHAKDDLASAVNKPVKDPRQYKSQPHLQWAQTAVTQVQSQYPAQANHQLVPQKSFGALEAEVRRAFYVDAVEHQPSDSQDAAWPAASSPDLSEEEELPDYHPAPYQSPNIHRSSGPLESVDAAEENPPWLPGDEDEDDGYDDQEAYTTAHSYRSIGDNTTGAVTTVVAPMITDQDLRELAKARQTVLLTTDPDDLEEESYDISMVTEYSEEIFEYMKTLERRLLPNPHYIEIQTEIRWSMRAVLMEWIVQIHSRFHLLPETLFLAVNYIDRFLSVKVVSMGKLQLVGVTALFLAAKYEEINCPSLAEVVYMVDSGYTAEEILKAERFMLSMLNFELGWPGPMSFLRRISKADEYDLDTRTMAKYFLEVTIMDERFVAAVPSYLSAGAHCLARLILNKGDWTPAHVAYSGFTLDHLKPLVLQIFECCKHPLEHHAAVYEKYASKKYKEVAKWVDTEIKTGFQLVFPVHRSLYFHWPDVQRFEHSGHADYIMGRN